MSFIITHRSTPGIPVRSAVYAVRRAALALALVGIGACNSLLDVDNPGSVTLTNSGPPGTKFALGGAISVNSTTVGGTYSGTFNVTVDY